MIRATLRELSLLQSKINVSISTPAVKTVATKKAPEKNWLRENWLRVVVHIGVWGPGLWLIWRFYNDDLGVDPVVTINNVTGRTAMILLILCLACTPLYVVTEFAQAIKVRRALGLYAFMYASVHFINFIALDYAFDLNFILADGVVEKPYIFVGLTALITLIALAITSTKWWMKRLKKNWTRLHWLVYPAGILVVIHFLWQAKGRGKIRAVRVQTILTVLLLIRVPPIRQRIIQTRMRLTKPLSKAPVPKAAPTSIRTKRNRLNKKRGGRIFARLVSCFIQRLAESQISPALRPCAKTAPLTPAETSLALPDQSIPPSLCPYTRGREKSLPTAPHAESPPTLRA